MEFDSVADLFISNLVAEAPEKIPDPVWVKSRISPNIASNLFSFPDMTSGDNSNIENIMGYADNLTFMDYLIREGYTNSIDLIYIDPPFFSESNYMSNVNIGTRKAPRIIKRKAFKDYWSSNLNDYLLSIKLRLSLMKELMSLNGSIFIHLDWHVSHYVKIVADAVFGSKHLVNEIIWCYGGGSGTKRHFHRKHDVILWYSKSSEYIFNPQYRDYSSGTLQRGLTKVKGENYKLNAEGALMNDWWSDINKILSPTSYENLKYPTQKPLALLNRIIATASNPKSVIADFYSGSGTTAIAADNNERQWIICDNGSLANQIVLKRLLEKTRRGFYHISEKNILVPQASTLTKVKSKDIQNGWAEIEISEYSTKEEPQKNDLSLIDFWEIDLDYDELVFNSDIQIVKSASNNGSEMPYSFRIPLKNKKQKIGIRIHDHHNNCTLIKQDI